MASPSQPKSLIFDLEVAPGKADKPDRIFMVGALRITSKLTTAFVADRFGTLPLRARRGA